MKKIIAALLLFSVLISGCSLFKKSPQEAVNNGAEKLAEVKKMSSKLLMSGTVVAPTGEKPSKVTFSLDMAVKSNLSDEKAPKSDMKLVLNVSADEFGGSGEVLVRAVDKKLFFNLASINIPGETGEALKTQFSSYLNTWWFVPLGEGNPIGKLTDEQKELQEKFKSAKFFVNAQEDGEEEVVGIPSNRYRVDLDKEALKNFILDIARVSGNQVSPEEEGFIADSLKDVIFSGAVWIGNDSALHRIRGNIAVQPKQGPATSLDVDYSAWDFGKDVEIAAPEGAQEFSPFMLFPLYGMLSGGLGDAGDSGGDMIPLDSPLGGSQLPSIVPE